MCGRYVMVSNVKTIESRFNLDSNGIALEPNYNVSPGEMAPIILDRDKHRLSIGQFGFSPHWAKKRMYLFNARSEGDFNKDNDPNYCGGKEIITKPAFRNSIRQKRCLIIADAFIEGPEKERLSQPYVVYLKNKKRPFAFAGIYEDYVDHSTGETFITFAIITTTTNALIAKINHPRSPVILRRQHERMWLNTKTPLSDITNLLSPYPSDEMNAYPINNRIKNPSLNEASLLEPTGERLVHESQVVFKKESKLFGMGHSPARERRNNP